MGTFLRTAGKVILSILGIGTAVYTGYEIASDLVSSGSQETASSTQAITVFDWNGIFVSLLVAAGITLLIYFIRRKKGK